MNAVIITTKPLPFYLLSPGEFERMVLWLVERKGYLRPIHLGEGGNEQGRDIVAYKTTDSGEELWYFQCKRYQTISASHLKTEIEKYNKLSIKDPRKRPAGIVFATNAVLTATNEDAVRACCDKYGYSCDFWAHSVLDMYIKEYPEIVKEFFGEHWANELSSSALHQLPPVQKDFTGRQADLAELTDIFEREGALIGLFGAGGVGKSSLALKLANQFPLSSFEAHIFIDLKGTSLEPISPENVMRHIVRSFYPTSQLPDNRTELISLYRSVLHGRRGLIIFDNARDSGQIEELIPPNTWTTLITSRKRFVIPGLYPKKIDVFEPDDACHL